MAMFQEMPTFAAEPGIHVESGGCSRRGTRRAVNEDNFVLDPENRFFIVADGVGGNGGGDVASAMACELLRPLLSRIHSSVSGDSEVHYDISRALQMTHELMVRRQARGGRTAQMAASLVLGVVRGQQLYLAAIGDSRAILIREGQAEVVTRDHTMAAGLVEAGVISAEEAASHPWRNVVYNVLGGRGCRGVGDIFVRHVDSGDRLILATDGVTDAVTPEEMVFATEQHLHPQPAAEWLVELAMRKGSTDDASGIVVYFDAQPVTMRPGQRHAGLDEFSQPPVRAHHRFEVKPWCM